MPTDYIADHVNLCELVDWSHPKGNHLVQFWENDDFLAKSVAHFISEGLAVGEGAIVIATREHLAAFIKSLEALGVDVQAVQKSGQLSMHDAVEVLSTFMIDGRPDSAKFDENIGGLVREVSTRFSGIRAYGEMVGLLWQDGNTSATISLENLWNELGRTYSFALLCGYSMSAFKDEAYRQSFANICDAHSHVFPSEDFLKLNPGNDQMRAVALLEQQAKSMQIELERRRSAESELRKNEQSLKDFFENASIGFHWLRPDGIIIRVNRAELELLGYSEEEYVGHPISEFHMDQDVSDDILTRLKRNETLKNYSARLKCKDGSIKQVMIDSNVLWEDGKFIHTRCFMRDITEQVRAEATAKEAQEKLQAELLNHNHTAQLLLESEAFQKLIVESSRDCIKVLDLEAHLLFMNRGGMKIFEICDFNIVKGACWLDFWNGEDKIAVTNSFETAKLGRIGEFVGYLETLQTKSPKWWHVVVSPIFDSEGKVSRVLAVSRDVTQLKEAQEDMKHALHAREEFMSIASHELKTPLTSLNLQMQLRKRFLAKGDLAHFSPESLSKQLSSDEKQIRRLVRLVDDMLDISRLQTGKFSLLLEEFDLCEMIRATLDDFSMQLETAGCSVSLSLGSPVIMGRWDHYRIEQVFVNLLTNAIKYAAGKPIEVRLSADENVAKLSVTDHGVGIAKADQERIFGQFERAISRTRISGLGLGLYIVKQIVDGHGGTVSVHSEPNVGSIFTVELPLRNELKS